MKAIRRYLTNRKEAKAPLIDILGDRKKVYEFAEFYDKNSEIIDVIEASHKLSYVDSSIFTSEQYKAFMQGIGVLKIFRGAKDMVLYWEEENKRLAEEANKRLEQDT